MSEDSLVTAEFTALRGEIMTRVELQHQLVSLTIIAASAFLGLGAQVNPFSAGDGASLTPLLSTTGLLLYPLLALLLAASWGHNALRIAQVAKYLDKLEAEHPGQLGWQTYLGRLKKGPFLSILSAQGIFAGTQALTIALALFQQRPRGQSLAEILWQAVSSGAISSFSPYDALTMALVVADLVAIVVTIVVTRERKVSAPKDPAPNDGKGANDTSASAPPVAPTT